MLALVSSSSSLSLQYPEEAHEVSLQAPVTTTSVSAIKRDNLHAILLDWSSIDVLFNLGFNIFGVFLGLDWRLSLSAT